MKIAIVCSSADHPINAHLSRWVDGKGGGIPILRKASELTGGDILFLISCSEIITDAQRAGYRHVLVIHASDLPRGRGWSPYVWDIVNGASRITVSLLNAEGAVDSGDIWHQVSFDLEGHELHDEINEKLFAAELELMDWAVENCDTARPRAQDGEPSYWPKRTPEHSRIEAGQSFAEVFDLLRVCDPARYPAFVEHRGAKYAVHLRKLG